MSGALHEFWMTLTFPQALQCLEILRRDGVLPDNIDRLWEMEVRIKYRTKERPGVEPGE